MTSVQVEEIASRILWGLDDIPGARAVVRKVLGDELVIEETAHLPTGDACAFRNARGAWEFRVRRGLRGARLRWALVHEAVEVELERLGFIGDVEALAEAVTGAVVMPRASFIRAAWRERMCHAALAHAFATTQTAVVLRFAEVALVRGSAVVHPRFVFTRGELPADGRGLVEKPVTDAPRRKALLAS